MFCNERENEKVPSSSLLGVTSAVAHPWNPCAVKFSEGEDFGEVGTFLSLSLSLLRFLSLINDVYKQKIKNYIL